MSDFILCFVKEFVKEKSKKKKSKKVKKRAEKTFPIPAASTPTEEQQTPGLGKR